MISQHANWKSGCLCGCVLFVSMILSDTRHLLNAGLMLGQRLRHWPNIKPALDKFLAFARQLSVWLRLHDDLMATAGYIRYCQSSKHDTLNL